MNGMIVGKFAPIHIGHLSMFTETLELCDNLMIIMCFDSRWVQKQPKEIRNCLGYEIRQKQLNAMVFKLRKIFPTKTILTTTIIEDEIPEYPNGWKEWANLIKEEVSRENYVVDKIFSNEISYISNFDKYFPEWSHVLLYTNRTKISISSTKIREAMQITLNNSLFNIV